MPDTTIATTDAGFLNRIYTDANRNELKFEAFRSYLSAAQYQDMYREVDLMALPKSAKVLDWGCGDGHFSYALLLKKLAVTAYKFHGKFQLRNLMETGGGNLVEADKGEPIKLPFKQGEFSCVFSIGVLEHVREVNGLEVESLKEIHRILEPGGQFFCCHFPNRGSLVEFVLRNLFPGRHHHLFLYNRKEIEQLLKDSGFQLVKAYRYGFLPKNIFRSFLGPLANSPGFTGMYFGIDRVLGKCLPSLAQNWFFLAKKS